MRPRIILAALFVRVFIALVTTTFFQPDEYFQSLEVAHHLVFGYGHLTWEWLSEKPIRSILYPGLNLPIYYALKWLKLDHTILLIWGPKALHGALAALTDMGLCELTRKVVGERYVPIALLVSLTSLFHGLSLSRSMSNSLETSLTTLSLSFFPYETHPRFWRAELRTSLAIAALSCAIRPTNAVLWIYMVAALMWSHRSDITFLKYTVVNLAAIGSTTFVIICGLDSLYHGQLTITPLNFVFTNLSSVSLFYGSSPWHYYLTQGLPILCTTALPFALHGMWLASGSAGSPPSKLLLGLLLWTISIYSLAGHKEWRFIHPLLPVLHMFAAKSLVDLSNRRNSAQPQGKDRTRTILPISKTYLSLLVFNLVPLVYLVFFHSRAQIDVMHYLRSLNESEVHSVGFLMPCHSTPWHAYLHKPTWADGHRFWALGCEPPLGGEPIQDYQDQTDVFYASPITYLYDRFPPQVNTSFPPSPRPYTKPGESARESAHDWRHEWPEYLVMFGAVVKEPGVQDKLRELGYRMVWHEEYGWEGDERRRGGVVVLRTS